MKQGSEYRLAEKPCIDELKRLGYEYLLPKDHAAHREGDNFVILNLKFIQAIQKINGIDAESAKDVYLHIQQTIDNEKFTRILRGNYSRTIDGESTKRTIKLIDFKNPGNNLFTVTNQFYVKTQHTPCTVCHKPQATPWLKWPLLLY